MHGLSEVKCPNEKKSFPLPFLNSILDFVVRHDMDSFMDDYSGYNQIIMVEVTKDKTVFISKWGAYAYK
jgi:hypothetical protein